MAYRDDGEALRARVEKLEEELSERDREHAENEALKLRVAELERRAAAEDAPSVDAASQVSGHRVKGHHVTPRPSSADLDLSALVQPPAPVDSGGLRSVALASAITTVFTTILLPFFGIGELFVGIECPPGVTRAYTRRYRLIRNGSKSDHAELRCEMADGKSVRGDETFSYLFSAGVGLSISLALLIGFALRSARRRRDAGSEREIPV